MKPGCISPSFPSEDLTYIYFTSAVDAFAEYMSGKIAAT